MRTLTLWSIFRHTDGLLDGAVTWSLARQLYKGTPGHYLALRMNTRGKYEVRDLDTGETLDSLEGTKAIRRLRKLNPEAELPNGLWAAHLPGQRSPFTGRTSIIVES